MKPYSRSDHLPNDPKPMERGREEGKKPSYDERLISNKHSHKKEKGFLDRPVRILLTDIPRIPGVYRASTGPKLRLRPGRNPREAIDF